MMAIPDVEISALH